MKVVLSHVSGSKLGCVEEFQAPSVHIGRGAPNDVALDPYLDPTVSAQHAEIRLEADGFVLYDMGSLNGTYVNGQPVRRVALKTGDEISLGRRGPIIVFRAEGRNGNGVKPSGLPATGETLPILSGHSNTVEESVFPEVAPSVAAVVSRPDRRHAPWIVVAILLATVLAVWFIAR